jgi:hypothetical protein
MVKALMVLVSMLILQCKYLDIMLVLLKELKVKLSAVIKGILQTILGMLEKSQLVWQDV